MKSEPPQTGAITGSDDGSTNITMNYDAAGRQTASTQNWSWTHTCGDTECEQDGTGTKTRSYDAENHLIGNDISQWNYVGGSPSGCLLAYDRLPTAPQLEGGTLNYVWGPNGHPDIWSQIGTLHWDGDTPLFVTNTSGAVAEVKVEGLGYYVPGSPFKFLDRNQSDFVVAAHWNGGHSAFTPADAQHQTCDGTDLSGAVLFEPGSDGIGDGVNVIQGVRAYDSGTGQWTSPDAFSGNVGDPMSQKAFMWNSNNSLSYADPSGYCNRTANGDPIASDESCTILRVKSCGSACQAQRAAAAAVAACQGQSICGPPVGPQDAAEIRNNKHWLDVIGKGAFSFLPGVEGTAALEEALGEDVAEDAAANAAPRVLQRGGHTLENRTVRGLNMSKDQAKRAMEGLKTDLGLPPNFHSTRIMSNGDVFNSDTGELLGNLNDYKQ